MVPQSENCVGVKKRNVTPARQNFGLKNIEIFLRLPLFVFFYFLINFDTQFKLDYTTYQSNYESEWRQFEPGFEALLSLFRGLNFSFPDVWSSLVIIEIALLAILFRKRIEFYLAVPNIYFLSQGLLGTQIRFAIAALLFIVIFRSAFSRRVKLALLASTITIHFGMLILFAQSIFQHNFMNSNFSIFSRKSMFSIAVFSLAAFLVAYSMDIFLSGFGYVYYIDTKFQEGKSLQSLGYLLVSLIILCLLARQRHDKEEAEMVYLAILITLFAVILSESSVIAGRLTLMYILIEPIIMAIIYERHGKKKKNFPFFIIYCAAVFAKSLTVSVVL